MYFAPAARPELFQALSRFRVRPPAGTIYPELRSPAAMPLMVKCMARWLLLSSSR